MTERTVYAFERLVVWQKAMALCKTLYQATRSFPADEAFGLTSQLRRAATSIPLNIAEGAACGSKREYSQFLRIALRSAYELLTAVEIADQLGYLPSESAKEFRSQTNEIGRLLHGLIRSITTTR